MATDTKKTSSKSTTKAAPAKKTTASAKESTTKTTKTTRRSHSSSTSAMGILDQLGFWAVLALALVMVINSIINVLAKCGVSIPSLGTATGILNKFAMAITIGITLFCSYFAARKKSKNLWILWLVSAILVGLCFILGIAIL